MNRCPLIYVIILNWNGKRDTLSCLASLEKTLYAPFKTVVIDNGSSDDSVAAIEAAFPEVTVVETGKNLGYAGGNNVGIERALKKGAELILLLNNDTEVDPHILSAFANYMERHPTEGIVGGCPFLFDQRDQLDHLGGVWNPKTARFDMVGNRTFAVDTLFENPKTLDYACGCSLMIRREVFEAVGAFEAAFFLFWEESDLCMRAKRAGFAVGACRDAILYHKVSASFVGGKPHTNYFWWRNRFLWIERNCNRKERVRLYIKVLLPELFQLWKNYVLKQLQIVLTHLISPTKDQSTRREKVRNYRAALQGAKDYFFKRFGNGPTWIFKKGD